MRKQTKVEKLQPENKLSHSFRVTTFKEEFIIPVIDVRDGPQYRQRASELEKAANTIKGSNFIKPTFSGYGPNYNTSTKKPKDK